MLHGVSGVVFISIACGRLAPIMLDTFTISTSYQGLQSDIKCDWSTVMSYLRCWSDYQLAQTGLHCEAVRQLSFVALANPPEVLE